MYHYFTYLHLTVNNGCQTFRHECLVGLYTTGIFSEIKDKGMNIALVSGDI
jgi:hypothetical protein